jgi:hypothetical protein
MIGRHAFLISQTHAFPQALSPKGLGPAAEQSYEGPWSERSRTVSFATVSNYPDVSIQRATYRDDL